MSNVPESVYEFELSFDWSPSNVFEFIQGAWDTADENEKCTLFDLARGLYWVCVDWHSGQWSELYRIQCGLNYNPGCGEGSPEDSDSDEDEGPRYVYEEIQRTIEGK